MKFIIFIYLTAISNLTFAADNQGRWMMGGGVGSLTCPQFKDEMRSARKHKTNSIAYVNKIQGFAMYISGFQSGYNQVAPETFDIFTDITIDQALAWTDHYCSSHSLTTFGNAVAELAKVAHAKRKVTLSMQSR